MGSAGMSANGCYTQANYHSHTGNASFSGGCYTNPVYHSHIVSCHCSGPSTLIGTEYGGDENYQRLLYRYRCTNCGVENLRSNHGTTWTECTGSTRLCGKTEGSTIDSYSLSCGKTTTTITGYILGCGKTTETIESATIIY